MEDVKGVRGIQPVSGETNRERVTLRQNSECLDEVMSYMGALLVVAGEEDSLMEVSCG